MNNRIFLLILLFSIFTSLLVNVYAQSKPGFCGSQQFIPVLNKVKNSVLKTNSFDSILSNVYFRSPETLIRLVHTNMVPFYSRALEESSDAFVLNKSLYGLLFYNDSFIPSNLVFSKLTHSNQSVRAQSLLLMGLRPNLFTKEDVTFYKDREINPHVLHLYRWVLNRIESRGESIILKQSMHNYSPLDEVVYFKGGQPADKYIPRHSSSDSEDLVPKLASDILAPVIDYDTELVFATPRKSFGVGTENIHLGDDCAWFRDGTPVFAIASGKVRLIISSLDWGTLVLIEHKTKYDQFFCSIYGHLGETVLVKTGQDIETGDIIGMTGMSYSAENGGYGSHLHFAIAEGRWQKPKFRSGFHARVGLGQNQVTAQIVGFEGQNVVIKHGEKLYGIPKDKDTLNDRIQWIKGYQTKEDGIKGWLDPLIFINENQ